jgi:hypothetical protein
VLFVLVDGLGLGPRDPAQNPVYAGACPALVRLLEQHAVPLDAGLGVGGIPQSATGQTALLTGLNAAQAVGRHVEGFPTPALKRLIEAHNLFGRLQRLGARCTFANAYYVTDVEEVRQRGFQSVTTVATLASLGGVRDVQALERGEAVYHDLTRATLRSRGYTGPLVSPELSAQHLLAIARAHDFTLFEYFLTDRAGHKGDRAAVLAVLGEFDRFLAAAAAFGEEPGSLFMLTSDHGNVEAAETRGHSRNPVPLVAVGARARELQQGVRGIEDVTPAMVRLFGGNL